MPHLKMKIDHIAIWVTDLEKMRAFYLKYFSCTSNSGYTNSIKKFSSFFIRFDSGPRIELMNRDDITESTLHQFVGYAHIAITVGSRAAVNKLTKRFEQDGITIQSQPRLTGDGYYESVVVDVEGNLIELVADE
jgi:lactoylglutathione lyase